MVDVKWEGGMRFVATSEEGDAITMEASPEGGGEGRGWRPVKLVLAGLGGCTGMELMWILKRQRQEVTGLKISLAGTKRKKEPQYYEDVRVEYAIRGRKLKDSAVKRALDMAVERYCPVRGMLRPEVRVTTSYRIEEEQ